jgi:hypothetical protein
MIGLGIIRAVQVGELARLPWEILIEAANDIDAPIQSRDNAREGGADSHLPVRLTGDEERPGGALIRVRSLDVVRANLGRRRVG